MLSARALRHKPPLRKRLALRAARTSPRCAAAPAARNRLSAARPCDMYAVCDMSPMIPKHTLDQIRDANDIVEVVSLYLPLKRAGSSYKALCPFHKEKTPSFHVNPARQIFHCFGCNKGGDVFRFIMEYENVDFSTAVRILAQRAGITVEWEESSETGEVNKDLLYRVLEDAATAFHTALLKMPEAARARAYLEERELGRKAIDDFLIGYAPPAPRNRFVEWARRKKYPLEVVEMAGLILKSDQGNEYFDRFCDRVMFTIRDEIGRIVGFSGRTLEDDSKTAKYVNSPESPVFKKSRLLFALDRARKRIADTRTAILCEGQIDTIRCHLAGFDNTVAAQGTALTEDHARILRRFADSVVVVMDADEAGEKAALRSAEVLLGAGLSVHVATLPEDEDPDSLIRTGGAEAFKGVLDRSCSVLAFLIAGLRKQGDLRNEAFRLRATQTVLDMIARAASGVQQTLLLEEAAMHLGIPIWTLQRDLNRRRSRTGRQQVEAPPAASAPPQSHPRAEVALCELLHHHPDVAPLVRKYLRADYWTDSACVWLAEKLLAWSENPENEPVQYWDDADEETQRLAATVMNSPPKIYGDEYTAEHAAKELICDLFTSYLERRREHLRQQTANAPESERAQYELESKMITIDLAKLRQGWDHAVPVLDAYRDTGM